MPRDPKPRNFSNPGESAPRGEITLSDLGDLCKDIPLGMSIVIVMTKDGITIRMSDHTTFSMSSVSFFFEKENARTLSSRLRSYIETFSRGKGKEPRDV